MNRAPAIAGAFCISAGALMEFARVQAGQIGEMDKSQERDDGAGKKDRRCRDEGRIEIGAWALFDHDGSGNHREGGQKDQESQDEVGVEHAIGQQWN